jgi:hypothetical protein
MNAPVAVDICEAAAIGNQGDWCQMALVLAVLRSVRHERFSCVVTAVTLLSPALLLRLLLLCSRSDLTRSGLSCAAAEKAASSLGASQIRRFSPNGAMGAVRAVLRACVHLELPNTNVGEVHRGRCPAAVLTLTPSPFSQNRLFAGAGVRAAGALRQVHREEAVDSHRLRCTRLLAMLQSLD